MKPLPAAWRSELGAVTEEVGSSEVTVSSRRPAAAVVTVASCLDSRALPRYSSWSQKWGCSCWLGAPLLASVSVVRAD